MLEERALWSFFAIWGKKKCKESLSLKFCILFVSSIFIKKSGRHCSQSLYAWNLCNNTPSARNNGSNISSKVFYFQNKRNNGNLWRNVQAACYCTYGMWTIDKPRLDPYTFSPWDMRQSEQATLNHLAFSRRLESGDGAKRCELEKQQGGGVRGEPWTDTN